MLLSLRPSTRILDAATFRLGQVLHSSLAPAAAAAAAGQPPRFLGVHLRTESDWFDYCTSEAARPASSGVHSFEECYVTAEAVARSAARLGLPERYSLVYVASGNFSAADAAHLLGAGFQAVASERRVCSRGAAVAGAGAEQQLSCRPLAANPPAGGRPLAAGEGREVAAAVDLQVILGADLFMGNVFSSFSGTVRLSQLAARPPLAAHQLAAAVYYNALLATTATDVAPLEAAAPLTLNPRPLTLSPGGPAADAAFLDPRPRAYAFSLTCFFIFFLSFR